MYCSESSALKNSCVFCKSSEFWQNTARFAPEFALLKLCSCHCCGKAVRNQECEAPFGRFSEWFLTSFPSRLPSRSVSEGRSTSLTLRVGVKTYDGHECPSYRTKIESSVFRPFLFSMSCSLRSQAHANSSCTSYPETRSSRFHPD